MKLRTQVARSILVPLVAAGAMLATGSPAAAAAPLNISNGLFINNGSLAWSTAASTTQGDRTVTRTTTGFAGINVTAPNGSVFHMTTGVSKYMFIGSGNHLLILEMTPTGGQVRHSVSIVDFSGTRPVERNVLFITARSQSVPPPHVQYSQGTGDAFFIFGSTGTQVTGTSIRRGDTGAVLCAGPPPFVPTQQLFGEATSTQLRVKMGGQVLSACARPPGSGG